MNCEELKDSCALYVLGLADGVEAKEIQEHLDRQCANCRREIDELRAVADLLPYVATQVEAPAAIKERLMEQVRAGKSTAAAVPSPFSWGFWAAVAAALVILVAGGSLFLNGLLERIAQQRQQLATLQEQLTRSQEILGYLTDARTRVVNLAGQPVAPAASGRIYWHPQLGFRFYAFQMPSLAPNRTYQLWAITDKAVLSAGVFTPGPGGQVLYNPANLPPPGEIKIFAVTEEPAGGLPSPTGQKYLVGQL